MALYTLWVAGFAASLSVIALFQTWKLADEGTVVPRSVWKWFVIGSALWPLFVGGALFSALIPRETWMKWLEKLEVKKTPAKLYMKSKKFAFVVRVRGEEWAVYHFEASDGKLGTLGFTKRADKFCIGLFCANHLSEEEAAAKLEESYAKESN